MLAEGAEGLVKNPPIGICVPSAIGPKLLRRPVMPACSLYLAIALSGNSTDAIDKNYSAAVGKVILQEAGLKPSEANKLQQMPWLDYIELANRAMAKYNEQAGITGRRSTV